MNFEIIAKNKINYLLVKEAQKFCSLDEDCCFITSEDDNYYFFSKKLKFVHLWFDNSWIISDCYSTPKWREYFVGLLSCYNGTQYSKESTVQTTTQFSYEDMIKTVTKETWNLLKPEIQAKIITKLTV